MEGDDSLLTTEDNNKEVVELEVAPALISVHPAHHSVAVAVGCELRVFNLREGCPVTLGAESGEVCHHKDSIRAIRYGAKGNVFVSAGDDKLVKIWTTDSWRCMYSVSTEKKVSAVAISDNGQFVCYADKFGVVWVVELDEFNENQALVTMFPKKPLDGAHEIQSYCLGHTEFVSCLAFVYNVDCPHGYLVSGSGDSTVRLWDFTSGLLLNTCDVGSEVGRLMANGTESNYFAITDLCATCDGSSICVAVQGIGTSLTSNFLWMVMGVSNLPGFDSSSLARVRIISGLTNCNSESGDQNHNILEDQQVPGGETLLQQLQGSLSIDKDVFSAAAEAVKTSMRNLLIKKQYSSEKREFRKRGRNDRKAKR
ncbi:WD40 repeat-containing protein [Cynara cardunculus var. scolymus]|uniref:WD40 repeat-containing protein n=1 Tax=Cynara cardunculus var. scolymus TaxID=59895 RepID=A0A118K7L0_CYNCS|nr:WD40 repeat-containing protein [Cynara cardunculus var. scolymus]